MLSAVALLFICATVTPAAPVTASSMKNKSDDWFSTDDGKKFLDNLISWQLDSGGWFKGYDTSAPKREMPEESHGLGTDPKADPWVGYGTFDNGHTYTELRLIARAYNATHRQDLLDAFNKGLDFIFKSQYENGGWPQRYPLPAESKGYGKDITLNDDAMLNVMLLLQDVGLKKTPFTFVDDSRQAAAVRAFDKGIDCFLKLQVVVNGTPTAWAQQYNVETLQPSKARAYELPSLTGDESAGVAVLLMSLDKPSSEIKRAIHNAAVWFDKSKITGIKTARREDKSLPKGFDVVVVQDPSAPTLWARYYELDTNRPFFCGRDGVKKYSLAEIEAERRSGYAWLRPWGDKVLSQYPKWCKKNGETPMIAAPPSTQTSSSDR
jgi:pectinesterase